jgi:hypothetical protein
METRNASAGSHKLLILLLLLAGPLAASAQTPAASDGISLTPKNGQSGEQQAVDRTACQQWAKGQTGFDPAQTGGGVPQAQYSSHHEQYRRAMAACLEGRGYAVALAAPAAAAAVYAAPAPVHYAPPPRPSLMWHPFGVRLDGGYSIASGNTSSNLEDGPYFGLGFTLFPIRSFPVGLRVDGSYAWYDARDKLLIANNAGLGHEEIYGGDVDLQINLGTHEQHAQLYLFGGAGRYRERTTFHQVSLVNGIVCGYYYCAPGQFYAVTDTLTTTSPWQKSWNAGLGWEIAIGNRGAFFIEGQYLELLPANHKQQFVPIRVGFRF